MPNQVINHAPQSADAAKGNSEPITKAEYNLIEIEMHRLGLTGKDILSICSNLYGVREKLSELKKSQFNELMGYFKKCANKSELDSVLSKLV